MILVGFVTFILLGIAIIIWLDVDFYFKRRIREEKTVFNVLINFAKERKYYLALALAFLLVGMVFGAL